MAHSYTKGLEQQDKLHSFSIQQWIIGTAVSILWVTFPGLVRKIIHDQFFSPKKVVPDEHQRKWRKKGQPFELAVNTDFIKCRQWGKGPALVCVHGWNGIGLQFYEFISKALDQDFSVIVFDGPAHGETAGKICSYFQMTDVVRSFIQQKDRFKLAGFIGHSFGAAAVVNALAKENTAIPGVLIAPALEITRFIDSAFARYGISKEIYMDLIGWFEKRYHYSFRQDDPVKLLRELKQSVLVVHDEGDRAISYDQTRKIVDRHSHFEWMGTSNLGHKRILLDRTVVESALMFIRTHNNIISV